MDSIKYYNENAKDFFNNTINVDMENLYEKFTKYLKKGAKILDAGCGSGRDSLNFINKGYEVTAIDGSEELAKMGSELIGKEVIVIDFHNINYKNEFDAIWASASLLHINRNEISVIIDKFLESLKEKGIFYMSFKYGDMEIERNGRFFNYYDEASFKKLMEKKNILLLESWISIDVRPDRQNEQWLNVIVQKV